MPIATPVAYDPQSPEVLADPFPAYAELRARCPLHRTDQFGHPLYTLSRAADVHALLTAPDEWSNVLGPGVGYAFGRTGDIQRFDPPEHTARRKFARPEFNLGRVAEIIPATRSLAERLIDEMEPLPS